MDLTSTHSSIHIRTPANIYKFKKFSQYYFLQLHYFKYCDEIYYGSGAFEFFLSWFAFQFNASHLKFGN